jgi:hypothetical protein
VSRALKSFIEKAWAQNPNERPPAADLAKKVKGGAFYPGADPGKVAAYAMRFGHRSSARQARAASANASPDFVMTEAESCNGPEAAL